jgi:acetylglutamate kinase
MKLVIRIGAIALQEALITNELVRVLRQLTFEGHQIVLVHTEALKPAVNVEKSTAQVAPGATQFQKNAYSAVKAEVFNQYVVAKLNKAGIPAIGLFCGDGNAGSRRMVSLKTIPDQRTCDPISVASFCLDAICSSSGVSVMANVRFASDNSCHSISTDQLAAGCAIAWQANALIFLTDDKGIYDKDGKIIRWLYTDQINLLADGSISPKMHRLLAACLDALKWGVYRVRIFPVSHIPSLPSFFTERLDCGTEIVLTP